MSSRSRKKGTPLDIRSDHTMTLSSLHTVESITAGSSRSMQLVQSRKTQPPKRIAQKPSGLPDIKLSEVYLHHDLPHLDQGFAWLVLAASTWLTSLVSGFIYCLGILVEYWRSYYGCQTPGAVLSAAIIGAMFFGAGTLSEFLTKKYNYWTTVIPGCILLSGGVGMTAIAPNISVVNTTLGLLAGMGVALVYAPSLKILQEYFKEHFRMAMAIVISVSGIAQVAFPTLVRLLVNKQGKTSALTLAAVLISGIPFVIFYVSRINKQGQLSEVIRKLYCMKSNEGHPGQIQLDETGLVHVGYTIPLSNEELLVNQKEVERVLSAGVHDASNTQVVQSSITKLHHLYMPTTRQPSPGNLSVPSSNRYKGLEKMNPKQQKALVHKELPAKHTRSRDEHATAGTAKKLPFLTIEPSSEQESSSSISIELAEDVSGSRVTEATKSDATAVSSGDRTESEVLSGPPSSMSFLGWSNNAAGGRYQPSENNSAQDDKALAGYQGGQISDTHKHLKEQEVLEIAKHQMTVMKDYFLDMARRHAEIAKQGNKENRAANDENAYLKSCQKTSAETDLNEIKTAPVNNSAVEQWQTPWAKDQTTNAFRQQASNYTTNASTPREQVALTVKDYFVGMAKQQALSELKNNSASGNYPLRASLQTQDGAAVTKNIVLNELLKAAKVVEPVIETLSPPSQGLDNTTSVTHKTINQDTRQFPWEVFENSGRENTHASLANNSAKDNKTTSTSHTQESEEMTSNTKYQMLSELLKRTKKTEATVETTDHPPTTNTRNKEDQETMNIAKQQMHMMRDYFLDMAKKKAEEEPQGATVYERVLQKQQQQQLQAQQSALGSQDTRKKTRDADYRNQREGKIKLEQLPYQAMYPASIHQNMIEGKTKMDSYEDQENVRQEIQHIQNSGRQYMYPEKDTLRHSTEEEQRRTLHPQPTYMGYEEKLYAHPIERILEQRIINRTRQLDKVKPVEDESARKRKLLDNREQGHQPFEKRHLHQQNTQKEQPQGNHHASWEENSEPIKTHETGEPKRRQTTTEKDHEMMKQKQDVVKEILWKFRRNTISEKPRLQPTRNTSQSADHAQPTPIKPLSDKVQKYTSILERKSAEHPDTNFTGTKIPQQSSQVKHSGPQHYEIENKQNESKPQDRDGVSYLEYSTYYDDYYKGFKKPMNMTQQGDRQLNEEQQQRKTPDRKLIPRKSDHQQRPTIGKDKQPQRHRDEKRTKSPVQSKSKSPRSSARSSPTGRPQKSILKGKKSQNAAKQARRTALLQNALRQTSATLTTKITKMLPKKASGESQSKTEAQQKSEVTFSKNQEMVSEKRPKLLSPPSRLPKFLQWGRPKQQSPETGKEQSQTRVDRKGDENFITGIGTSNTRQLSWTGKEIDASDLSVIEHDQYQTPISKYLYRNQIPVAATEDPSDTTTESSSETNSRVRSDKKGASEAELLKVATELLYVLENPEDALQRSQTTSAKSSSKKLTNSRFSSSSGNHRRDTPTEMIQDLSGDIQDINASHYDSSHKTGRASQETGRISANSYFAKKVSGKSRAGQSGQSTTNKDSTKSLQGKRTKSKDPNKLDSYFSNSLGKSTSNSAISLHNHSAKRSKYSVDEKFQAWLTKTFISMDTSLATNKRYIIYLASTVCYTLGYFVPLFFTPLLSVQMGNETHTGALIISILAATGLAGQFVLERLLVGINTLFINTLSLLLAGTILCLTALVQSGGLMALCGLYGFFAAHFIGLRSMILIELTVMRQLETANALLEILQGIATFVGIMVAGALCDILHTVRSAFVMAGVTLILSGFISATLVRPNLFKESRHARNI